MGSWWHWFRDVLPLVLMGAAETILVGQSTLYKAALLKGLNYHVFMVYSYALSALILLPLAFIFPRRTQLSQSTGVLVCKLFFLGFLVYTGQQLGYSGIAYSSPILGSVTSNLTPVSTMALAVLFRMEKLKLNSIGCQAKIIGALVLISGALVVVLYHGPILITGHNDKPNTSNNVVRSNVIVSDWIFGGALLACSNVVLSVALIFQAKYVKEYPSEFVVVFFINFFSFIMSVPVGIASEPYMSSWKVQADIRLFSILYSGMLTTGFYGMVMTWVLNVKGPVFVVLFKPFSIAIAVVLGVVFLGDNLYLGSAIGSVVITVGFYTVMWGKAKEVDNQESSTNDESIPLLE